MNIFLGSKVLENKACLHVFSNGYYAEVYQLVKILMKNQALNRENLSVGIRFSFFFALCIVRF